MRIYLIIAILGLMVMEALLLPRTVKDFRIMRKMRAETAPEEGLPVLLGPFAGYDAAGLPLTLIPKDTKWVVPIVIHSGQMSSDLEYLARLRNAIPNRAIFLLGVCDGGPCGAGLPGQAVTTGFPILAYGSYAPLKDIARFDDRGQILILNEFWGVKQAVRRAPSADELAAQILQVTGQ